jgi:beta-phosphoglucomutase-like phosphatase (HAD superfamily)
MLLILDCDGVLVDSERLSHGVRHRKLREHGVSATSVDTLERLLGASMPQCTACVAALPGQQTA